MIEFKKIIEETEIWKCLQRDKHIVLTSVSYRCSKTVLNLLVHKPAVI